jgi:hypothetical protein
MRNFDPYNLLSTVIGISIAVMFKFPVMLSEFVMLPEPAVISELLREVDKVNRFNPVFQVIEFSIDRKK